jgi:ATP-dependent Clp protease ATP-binding subunit ClpB
VRYLSERLAERDMALELTDAALDVIGEAGFDPIYGARPLKRVLQQRVENLLAQRILAGDFGAGDRIRVDATGEGDERALTLERISH